MIHIEDLKTTIAALKDDRFLDKSDPYQSGWSFGARIAAISLQLLIDTHESDQDRVARWVVETLGEDCLKNLRERKLRFFEEALELVQSLGLPKEDVLKLVEYVYSRKPGEPHQELGGVMTTILALATSSNFNAYEELRRETDRIFEAKDSIRAKHQEKIAQGLAE